MIRKGIVSMKFKNKLTALLVLLLVTFSLAPDRNLNREGRSISSVGYTMDDVEKLKNDKEALIGVFSKRQRRKVLERYPDADFQAQLADLFSLSMLKFLNNSKLRCELNLVESFKSTLSQAQITARPEDMLDYIKVLRSNHQIDDILYEFLEGLITDYHQLLKFDNIRIKGSQKYKNQLIQSTVRSSRELRKLLEVNDLNELYSNFTLWPDEEDFCLYQEVNFIKTDLRDYKNPGKKVNKKRKSAILKLLNRQAFADGIISTRTFVKLEYLRKDSFVKDRYLRLADYLKVIFNAKNRLRPINADYEIVDIEKESEFSSEKLGRFSKITRRKDLYEKYNETQIVMLAQVLVKASRRMGVDPDVTASRPVITQSFEFINQFGERENYVEEIVLDPQSQYNLARKRMKKDMLDLEATDMFVGVNIYYDEVVMAAFETGYLTMEDIEYAIQYDDLWNPEKTKFERIMGFIFRITGYATFFVPPPWNVTATLGLAIIQGAIDKHNVKGADNENAATFID